MFGCDRNRTKQFKNILQAQSHIIMNHHRVLIACEKKKQKENTKHW